MSPIPTYWYVESTDGSVSGEHLPVGVIAPSPSDSGSPVVLVDADGEVHGEAILMSRLPWPRFRCFSTGQQVTLPHGAAVAFERFEAAIFADPILKPDCSQCGGKLREGRYRVRVEIVDAKLYPVYECHLHFLYDRRGPIPRPASPACLPGEGQGGPVKGSEGPKACPLTGGRTSPSNPSKQPVGRVLDI